MKKELIFMIFNKNNKLINNGTCKTVNEFKDYKIVKKATINNISYEITEKYFDNKLFCKEFVKVNCITSNIYVKSVYIR